MQAPGSAPSGADAEAIRLQAEEHPLIEDAPPANAAEHCLRLMHLRAYHEAVAHAEGRDVLDVGCNTGYGTVRFVPAARSVTGVDVSPRAIEAARARAVDGRPRFELTDGLELAFPDGAFDLVTSFQVLEHVPDPVPYLRGLRRVTRPGGLVILATPNAATRLDPGMTPWNRFHVREYRADELREVLVGVFEDVRVRGMFGTPTLYETEIRRVDAARQRMRRVAAAERACEIAPPPPAVRPPAIRPSLPRRAARRMLPVAVRRGLRLVLGGASSHPGAQAASAPVAAARAPDGPGSTMPLDEFLRFDVEDLFYADHDLERAMDLLAICRV